MTPTEMRRARAALFLVVLVSVSAAIARFGFAPGPTDPPRRPRLVLALVIDQFRADYLTRFAERLKKSDGGIQFLIRNGATFPFAEYRILQAMTGPGHATILTGAYPYQNGIPANSWYSDEKRQDVYCCEDADSDLVGSGGVIQGSGASGRSPKNMVANALGDEIKNAGIPGKVISVALKDRAAILMGGHRADLSLWFDPMAFEWRSSRYYLPEGTLPEWVARMNSEVAKKKGQTLTWKLAANEPGSGLSLPASEIPENRYHADTKKDFPHEAKAEGYSAMAMPFAVELTVTAAKQALDEVALGQDEMPDLLAVSFSTHDYVGHLFGANSREAEEMTLIIDQAIGEILDHIESTIPGGIDSTIIALTGDHGVVPNPEWLARHRHPAGRITDEQLKQTGESALTRRYGPARTGDWIETIRTFNLYLNEKELSRAGLDGPRRAEAEDVVAEALQKLDGVQLVINGTDLREGRIPPGLFGEQAMNTWYPGRSGDLIVVPKPFFTDPGDVANHVTGYTYDRMVPLLIFGDSVEPGRYATPVEIVDLAPTLAYLSGVLPPAMSEGRILHEAMR